MNEPRNATVSWLLARSFGQGGAVAVPGSDIDEQVIRGASPPGVKEVLAHLSNRYAAAASDETPSSVEWCFLVGGPGNGKSETLRILAERLEIPMPPRDAGDPAPRSLPPEWPTQAAPLPSGESIVLVNDASIPRPRSSQHAGGGSLVQDVQDAIEYCVSVRNIALFANVNRGIAIEEANTLNDHAISGPGELVAHSVIRWLATPPGAGATSFPNLVTTVPVTAKTPYYGQFRVDLGSAGRDISVVGHALFLDTLSLFEPAPGAGMPAIDFSSPIPRVQPYSPLGGVYDGDNVSRGSTVAGGLIGEAIGTERWGQGECRNEMGVLCRAYSMCPFANNARWLGVTELRHRWTDISRAAEIAAGRRFTYRDLLGHTALSIIGEPEESWLHGEHPCDWVRAQIPPGDTSSPSPESVVRLVSHRVYSSIFPSPDPAGWRAAAGPALKNSMHDKVIERMAPSGEPARSRNFTNAFRKLDPSSDADDWTGLRFQVLDAVEAIDVVPPSLEVSGWESIPPEAHSPLEAALDVALVKELMVAAASPSQAAATRSRVLRRWRSVLLLRQIGLARGHFGGRAAVRAWLQEHQSALAGRILMRLGKSLQQMVLPTTPSRLFLMAPLRPRTSAFRSDFPATTVLVSVAEDYFRVKIVAHGDTLAAELREVVGNESKVLASIAIDFAIAREAILQSETASEGFTEIGPSAFARVERARAALTAPGATRTGFVHFTDGAGDLFQILPASGNAPRFKVISMENP